MRKINRIGLFLAVAVFTVTATAQTIGTSGSGGGSGGGGGSVTGGACPSGQYTLSVNTSGVPTCSQVNWSQLGGVPSTFTPAAHIHAGADITSGTVAAPRLGTGTPNSTTFLRGDGSWQPVPGGGDALTGSPLSQFAPTTSAQLRLVLSDESGTGEAYFAGGNLGTPSSGILTNATGYQWVNLAGVPSTFAPSAHNHGASDITGGVFPPARLGSGSPGATNFLRGDGAFVAVDYSLLTGVPSTFAPAAHNHAGTEITSGLVPSARLAPSPGGTGATCLGDNQTWVSCGGGGGGESNTASNLSGGIGLFASKVGVDLRFKSILAGSTQISVVANGSGNTVDIDLVPANVLITSLSGWPVGLTTAELGYVANVTSDIQTQLNAKATMARTDGGTQTTSYAFTRTAPLQQWKLTLGGNVTSTTSGLVSGDLLSFEICQDVTGGRTFTWPTGFSKASTVVSTASTCSKQIFTWNGTSAEPQAGMISDETGVIVRGPTVAALGTPASGSVCWIDSTAGGWSCKDSSGNVTIMPRVESSATSNQFVTHIPASGVPAKAQPSFSNLSGTATDAQVPNLNTLSTGLTALRCVETDGAGNLTVAAALCNVSGGGGTVTSVDAAGGVETASGSPITTSGTIRASMLVNAQTGTTYTIVTGDRGKLVTLSNASAIAVTLPQAGGTFPAGWYFIARNLGAGAVTVTPTTSTIAGAASITIDTGEWALITSDGTNYQTMANRITAGANVTLTKSTTGTQVAASGGGGGGTACPTSLPLIVGAPLQYLAANGYSNDNVINPATASLANTPAGTRVYIPCDFNPQSLSFSIQTAGASTCTFAVGIYDSSNTLVISSGIIRGDGSTTVACNSTGTKTLTSATSPAATGLNTSYSAGAYTIAYGTNEATTVMRVRALPVHTGWGGLINGVDSTMMGYWTTPQAWSAGAPASSFTYGSGFNSSVVSVPLTILKLQ